MRGTLICFSDTPTNSNQFQPVPTISNQFQPIAEDAQPGCNQQETSDTPKLRDILQNNQHVVFKSVKVIKIKERLKNYSRLKKTKET